MQKYEVIILPLAEKDIKSNTDYIFYEKEMPDVAVKLLNGFYKTMKEPEISERFDLEDIRKIRDYNSWRHSQMTTEEIIAEGRKSVEWFQNEMDKIRKSRESKEEA